MIDRLLGRESLKRQIETLSEEKRHLERERDAESKRRADAVSARQDAQQRVNRLEDRIAELEDRVERSTDNEDELSFHRDELVSGDRLGAVLDRLESYETGPEGMFTAYVANAHDLSDAVRDTFGDATPLITRAAPCLAITDDAGLMNTCVSVPLPPDPFATWDDHARLDREWFEPTGTFALALVRSDLFALGEYDGAARRAFHGFDADLKSQHSKGGFSQARFERLRDAQIDSHLDRAMAALEERTTRRLYIVGERSVLSAFEDVADVTRPVDATGEPEAALDDAFYEFFSVRLSSM